MNESNAGIPPNTAGNPLVLVVDDEPRNVQLLQDLLELRGYAVLTAVDGAEGLALARERSPDVVLLDVMMPLLSGFDVCRKLKEDQATAMIPVLLVTSLDAREDRLAGIGAGANDFLTKPIDSGDLLLRVRNAVTTKRLHDEVTSNLKQLRQLEAARDTLTHMIVHDLRSPLTGLQGYLDLLRMAALAGTSSEVLEYARDANGVAAQLKEMVSQVLDVSRLESGQMPLTKVDTDLVPVLRAAVSSLGPTPPGARFVYDGFGGPVVVTCDPDILERVIANLVGNALKFLPRDGLVRIGLDDCQDSVHITITDNGPGIPSEYHGLIFEKFRQGPGGRAAAARSAGLGLAFCRLAVEAHGGRISVEHAESGGARFRVELPRQG